MELFFKGQQDGFFTPVEMLLSFVSRQKGRNPFTFYQMSGSVLKSKFMRGVLDQDF